MTDFRTLCEELNGLLEYISDINPHLCEDEINNLTNSARAALAEQPVGQSRRCIYNPVQIAECGGPCEQIGPEACDCGALWVSQDAEQPVEPTDKELCETYQTAYYAEENRQGPHCMAAGLRAVLARWGQL